MRAVDIIAKKRDGHVLNDAEIRYLIAGYTDGSIPDYQMSAFAMAVYFQGMTAEETAHLTMAMAASGDQVNPDEVPGIFVDKHSTGGVGDKTSLVVAPLVAAAGVSVAKMSGRGLGHTGGTIDKLESIPGFQVELDAAAFFNQVARVGIAIVGQSGNLTPADKKLYALRDVTATVESIPLIAASIMSKKIASGARAIVLDVKTGDGAFMKTYEDAEALAKAMVEIGTQVGRETVAIISDMNQPLGYAVGNANEVIEAISTLQGHGPEDLTTLSLTIGGWMLKVAGKVDTAKAGIAYLRGQMIDGQAIHTFENWIHEQHGDARVTSDRTLFPQASQQQSIVAKQTGYVTAIAAEAIGHAAMLLGAGRARKNDSIDLGVGIQLRKKVGERVEMGEELALCQWNACEMSRVREACEAVGDAFQVTDEQITPPPLIYAIIDAQGVHPYTGS